MRFNKRAVIVVVLVLAAVAVTAAFMMKRKSPPEYFTQKVDRGDIRDVVEATGTINAVTTVQVGSQVSGRIGKLMADFNSRVSAGQVIARIDPELFEGNLLQAKADLENARANLAAARANLEKSKAASVQTKSEFERTQGLADQGIMSQQQLDVARANYDSAVAAVSAAQAQVTQAAAQVSQRQAAVTVAQTNLDHTIIKSPIDGIVVNRAVDVGQTVAASLQAPTLFTIAQDLTKMQVYAKTDESDVGQMRPGLPVLFKVDAFPRDQFRGRVVQVRMNATTVQNVVTYDTIIEFDNPEMKLFPGMTAYVSIPVAAANNVIKIPNGALRFKPDMAAEEVRALYKQYGIDMMAGRRGGDSSAVANTGGAPAQGSAVVPVPAPTNAGGTPPAAEGQRQWRRGEQGGDGQQAGQLRGRGQGSAPGGRGQRPQGEQPGGGVNPMPQRAVDPGEVMVVWKLKADKTLEPIQLRTGITDHTFTALIAPMKGELKEGDELIIGMRSSTGGGMAAPPGMGARPGGPGGGGGPQRR